MLWTVVAAGVLLRLWLLLHRPWLWLDEAHLAPNVLERDFVGLLKPLGNDQMAPVGYLLIAKLSALLLGPTELALRSPSFLAGCAALALFVPLARRLGLSPTASLALVALAAIMPPFIRYSAELKQYAFELLVAMLALLAALRALDRPGLTGRAPLLALGFTAALVSLSAPFVLAGVTLPLLARDVLRRQWRTAAVTSVAAAGWGALYLGHYLLIRNPAVDGKFAQWWAADFGPRSPGLISWAINHYNDYAGFLTGAEATRALFALLTVAGAVVLARRRGLALVAICLLPLLFAMLGAVAHAYPFVGRLILFAAPGILLLAVAGAAAIFSALRGEVALGAAAGALVFLALPIVSRGTAQALRFQDEPFPAVMAHVARQRQPGEAIYVHALGLPLWRLYRDRFPSLGSRNGEVIAGADSRVGLAYFLRDMDELAGRERVWLVMARGHTDGAEDQRLARYFAALRGRVIATHQQGASTALLVDFSLPPAGTGRLAPATLPPYRAYHSSYELNERPQ